jgi:Tfp pilus assembly protein PilO
MRNRPVLIGLLVAILLALAFYFFLWKPASQEQARVAAETLTLQDQQRSLEAQIAQLREIERNQVEINAAKARLEEFIPNGSAQPSAIRQLQAAADAAGTDIASVTFADPAVPDPAAGAVPGDTGDPGTTLANIPVTMAVDGGYFQIVDFLRRVEVDVPRAVLLETVNIVEEPTASFPTLRTTWTGQMFAVIPAADLVDTGAAPAPGAPAPGATPTPAPTPGGDS